MFVAPLAIDLTVILACLVALGIILTSKLMAEALVKVVRGIAGKVPIIGDIFAKSANWVEAHIVSALDDAVNGVEGVIGSFWHALGNLISSIGNEIYGLAKALNQFGAYMHGVVRPWVIRTVTNGLLHGVKWLRRELRQTVTQVYRVTKVIEHPIHTKIGGAVRAITKPMAASLAHLERWTRTQVAALHRAVAVTIPRELHGLWGQTHALSRLYERLWKQVRELNKLKAASVATGIVALALTRLGFGWLACRNVSQLGRRVCRMDANSLDGLLGLTLAVVGSISIVEFAKEMQGVVKAEADAMRALIREA